MWKLKFLVLTLWIGAIYSSSLAGQQPAHCAQNLFCLYNQEAAASDPAGIHKYSEDLIRSVVPSEAKEIDKEQLADRLARAEQMARTGNGKLVAEADVVRAFNELMAKIGAPSSVRADESSMHRFREHAASIKAFPALLSADRNGTNCNPAEAVFLLSILLDNNGNLSGQLLDLASWEMNEAEMSNMRSQGGIQSQMVLSSSPMYQGATGLLSLYSLRHHCRATTNLFNMTAKTFGF